MGVFISYSTKDRIFVDQLSVELINNRIGVWLDKWEMKPGDSLLDKIQAGLTDSSFLLVVLSNNSINSEWCKKELNAGLMRELNEKKVLVIPVLIEDCQIPLFLQEKVYADFRTDFTSGFESLLRPLSKLFSEHVGRQENNNVVTDYVIHWEIKENKYYMTIDLINWYEKERKSILLQIEIIGCENVVAKFKKQSQQGLGWLMKESIITMMYMNPDFRNLNILTQSNDIYNRKIKAKDLAEDITFDIKIRAILMGEDNGNDVLINFIDFLEMLHGSIKDRIDK